MWNVFNDILTVLQLWCVTAYNILFTLGSNDKPHEAFFLQSLTDTLCKKLLSYTPENSTDQSRRLSEIDNL